MDVAVKIMLFQNTALKGHTNKDAKKDGIDKQALARQVLRVSLRP